MRTTDLEVECDLPLYMELPPSPDLAPWISHFRIIRGGKASSTAPATLRLLTDGCAGVVIDCGPSSAPSTPPVFIGVMQSAAVLPFAERRDVIGVRFKPGGALPFVTAPLDALTGRRVPLPLLWGDLAQRMGLAVRSAPLGERVAALEHCLRRRLHQQRSVAGRKRAMAAREIALVSQAIAHLERDATVRVREVAVELGVGERRLERMFNRAVGVPPKVFYRMRRCYEAARLIRQSCRKDAALRRDRSITPCNWSAIGSAAGYADQAHFIREFRALAGVTPVAYAAEPHPVGFMQYDGSRAT